MIKTEIVTINELQLIYTYSDEGRYVVRDGISYEEAYDPIDSNRTYIEGDVIEDVEAAEEDYLEALAKLGVIENEEA